MEPTVAAGHEADRVRVEKFQWERLMMVSSLPWPTRSILLALAIYMAEDGSSARPGLAAMVQLTRGRSVVIEHLQAAVDAGYLVVVERGGYRRQTARATEYAATVPADVFARRDAILSAPPWRRQDGTPTSGQPDLGLDERPANRTLVGTSTSGQPDVRESPRSGSEPRRSGFDGRTSGQPDPINHSTSTTHHQEDQEQAPRSPARGCRIPGDFSVSPEMRAWHREHAAAVDLTRETLQFRDHWQAASGAKAIKADWTAAWRTWMRNAVKYDARDRRGPANRFVHNRPDRRAADNPFSGAIRGSQHTTGDHR